MKTALSVSLCLLAFLSSAAFAFENKTESENFSDAAKAKSYLRFDINTKKLGFIKSHVTGYVKKFTAAGKIEGKKLKDAQIEFPVKELDSDLYQRNDQMWNYCLGEKENPKILVKLPSASFTEGAATKVVATITVRGKEKPLSLELRLEKVDGRWVAMGKGDTSFKELEIPDPSIGVASVDGPISVEFHIEDLSR